jgi:hypothetical protein
MYLAFRVQGLMNLMAPQLLLRLGISFSLTAATLAAQPAANYVISTVVGSGKIVSVPFRAERLPSA